MQWTLFERGRCKWKKLVACRSGYGTELSSNKGDTCGKELCLMGDNVTSRGFVHLNDELKKCVYEYLDLWSRARHSMTNKNLNYLVEKVTYEFLRHENSQCLNKSRLSIKAYRDALCF